MFHYFNRKSYSKQYKQNPELLDIKSEEVIEKNELLKPPLKIKYKEINKRQLYLTKNDNGGVIFN